MFMLLLFFICVQADVVSQTWRLHEVLYPEPEKNSSFYPQSLYSVISLWDDAAQTWLPPTIPGPEVRARVGDTVVIHVINEMATEVTILTFLQLCKVSGIHFHGIHQYNSVEQDGVPMVTQCFIVPGTNWTYTFVPDYPGTNWYHEHISTHTVGRGIFGPVVVLPKIGVRDAFPVDGEATLMVYEAFRESTGSLYYKVHNNSTSFFGPSYPTKSVDGWNVGALPFGLALINGRPGKWCNDLTSCNWNLTHLYEVSFQPASPYGYKLRIINSGTVFPFIFSIDNHQFAILATDGHDLNGQSVVDSLIVHNGERYDVLINMNNIPGNYWIRFKTIEHHDNRNISVNNEVRAILRYQNVPLGLPTSNYTGPGTIMNCFDMGDIPNCFGIEHLVPNVNQPKVEQPNKFKVLHFAYNHTLFTHTTTMVVNETKNHIPFELPSYPVLIEGEGGLTANTITIKVNIGDVVQIEMFHNTAQSHPIHLHGHHFWVVASGKSNVQNTRWNGTITDDDPIVKDTAVLPSGGWLVIRYRANNPGWWMFHCHIDIHLADGMAVLIKESPLPEFPRDGSKFCGPKAAFTVAPAPDRTVVIILGVTVGVLFVVVIIVCLYFQRRTTTATEIMEPEHKGILKRREGAIVKSWYPRWCVLVGNKLHIYKNQTDSKPTDTITLTVDTLCHPCTTLNIENCIEIRQQKTTYLCAENSGEMDTWLKLLVKAPFSGSMSTETTGTSEEISRAQLIEQRGLVRKPPKSLVYSVKGMLCNEHVERVKSLLLTDLQGVEKLHLDGESEYLYISGTFDEEILRNSIERAGFLIYDEPAVKSIL